MIRLYRAPWSTNCERVGLALAHKGLEVESVVIDYSDRSVVEAVSGQGLVPVIEDGGEVIADSTAILRHLEERHPDPPLVPSDPARAAEMWVFVDWFNQVWKAPSNALEDELELGEPDRTKVKELGDRIQDLLATFEELLAGRDHLWGEEFSVADCAAFPFVKYALLRDPDDDELFHRIIDTYQELGSDHPQVKAWIERTNERPRAYGETVAPPR